MRFRPLLAIFIPMGRLITLAGFSKNGQAWAKPRVVYINEDHIVDVITGSKSTSLTKVIVEKEGKRETYLVFEKAIEIEAQRNPSTTDLIIKQQVAAGITPAGSVQGGTTLSKYFNEATTLGSGATDAVTLPVGTKNRAICIVNNDASGDALEVFPNTGEKINNGAANAKLVGDIASGARKHLVYNGGTDPAYPTYGTSWIVCDDFGD